MALLRDMICRARPSVSQIIHEEIKSLNLKIIKQLTIKFDPFREDVKQIRDFSFLIHSQQAKVSNPKLLIKTEILTDRSEQLLNFDLTDGQKFIFKCGNLKLEEIFQLINKYITPLSPVEDILESHPKKLAKKAKKK